MVAVKHAEEIAVLLEHVAKVNWAKLLTLSKEPGLLMLVNSNSQPRFVLLVIAYQFLSLASCAQIILNFFPRYVRVRSPYELSYRLSSIATFHIVLELLNTSSAVINMQPLVI